MKKIFTLVYCFLKPLFYNLVLKNTTITGLEPATTRFVVGYSTIELYDHT